MWQNIAIAMIALLLVSGIASRLTQGRPAPEPTGPRAPDYTKGWTLPEQAAPAPDPAPAAAAALAPAPAPAPVPEKPALVATTQRLDGLWASKDWDGVISLLEAQQRAATPIFGPAVLREKLYAAEVNAGRTLLQQGGDVAKARQHFQRAIEVDPVRPEARDAIRAAN